MMAAPRFCTVVMKSPRSHSPSVMTSVAGLPPMRALAKSGNWVAEWLPQMATLVTSATGRPALAASWALARFSSRRVMANQRSAGHLGRVGAGDQAVRVAGVADDQDAHVGGGVLGDGPALRLEDAAVDAEEVAALHARLAGDGADEERPRRAVEGGLEVRGGDDVVHQREGAVVDLHDDALEHPHGRLDLEQAQHDRLVLAEELARGDAEQERVADLAGGAGDGDVEGGLSHGAGGPFRRVVGAAVATRSGGAVGQRRSTMAEANSEHLTSVAPSIRRAKS